MFDDFRLRMMMQGKTMGEALKRQSDMIMDATFTRDPAFRVCYLQDAGTIFPEQNLSGYKKAKAVFQGKDKYNPKKLRGFHPIDCKYLINRKFQISGDAVDYYLQFRPLEHGKNPNVRVGAFVFIPDDLERYNLWLIVGRDDDPQFPKYNVLKCNLLLKWAIEEKDRSMFEGKHVDTGSIFSWAVQRTQSSYNSGVWMDYVSQSVENQLKAIVPTNSDTYTINYNERFVISDNPLRRVAWMTSKLEPTTTWGLTKLTFTQELEFDPVDNISWINFQSDNYSDTKTGSEYDYYKARTNDENLHDPINPSKIKSSVISYTGLSPVMKIGGSFKTFIANFYEDGELVIKKPYWKIDYYNNDNLICTLQFIYVNDQLVFDNSDNDFEVDGNKIIYSENGNQLFGIQFKYNDAVPMELQIKCLSILNMIGGNVVLYIDDEQTTSLKVEVDSL